MHILLSIQKMASFIKPKKAKKEEEKIIAVPKHTDVSNVSNRLSSSNNAPLIFPGRCFKNPNVVEKIIETKELDQIEFTFLSDEEIVNGSVVEINETKLGGPNSLYDLKMGPITTSEICETCESNWEECPGHFGHIKLAVKIPHPILYKKILEYLKLFCLSCKKIVITDKRIKLTGANKLKKEYKFQKILKDITENIESCMHCNSKLPVVTFLDDKYIKEVNGKKLPLMYNEIAELFLNVTEIDMLKLGLNPKKIHPSHYIINNLLVVPTCVRPPVLQIEDGGQNHDDLTYKYVDILKTNKKLSESTNENTIFNYTNNLVFHVRTLFNNSKGKARDLQGRRPIKCIKKRLSGKSGIVRKHIQGKRTNFCARTVIGPEANCMVDELIVPQEMADKVTYPVNVSAFNLEHCQKLLEEDKVNFVIRDNRKNCVKYACWDRRNETILKDGDILLREGKMYPVERLQTFNPSFSLKDGDKIIRKIVKEGTNIVETRTIDAVIPKRKPYPLKPGDVIERHLQNGDWVVFNRQPTLWKGSMRAKKIVLRPGKTFRFNLASTAAFNADFDGDEMNMWLPQTELGKAECATILSTSSNFLSSQDSKPLIGLKQDGMTGGYLLTYGYQKIEKYIFMEVLTTEYFELSHIFEKIDHIKLVHKKEGMLDKKINEIKNKNSDNISKITNKIISLKETQKKLKTQHSKSFGDQKIALKDKFDNYKEQIQNLEKEIENLKYSNTEQNITEQAEDELLYTGHSLFSFLLKNDFEYSCKNDISPDGSQVYITRGVLLSGTLNKVALGNSSGSLIHHLAKDYGNDEAIKFVSYYEMMINNWLIHRGFSIGMTDCIPKNTDLIEKEVNKYMLEASVVMNNEKDREILESKVNNILNKAATIGQRIASEALEPTNNLVSMIKSGAKGNIFNITQVTGLVGQQNVGGLRMQKTFGGRTLPHYVKRGFTKDTPDIISQNTELSNKELKDLFESRGFVTNSFFKGLNAKEFFFHASGGREGLIDTACKTADTGYIQRRIIKMIEDCYYTHNGVIHQGIGGNIIEFMYGGDNLDASKLIKTSEGFSCIDISHTVDKLNKNFEWKSEQVL